jgi:hypothetical protein
MKQRRRRRKIADEVLRRFPKIVLTRCANRMFMRRMVFHAIRSTAILAIIVFSCALPPVAAGASEDNTTDRVASDVLAVDAGGPRVGHWKADTGSPAYTVRSKFAVSTIGVRDSAPEKIYETQRFFRGMLAYSFAGLQPQTAYTVRLHFAELIENARGKRIFNILLNDRQVCRNLDVFLAAGGKFRAIAMNLAATADAKGEINVALIPVRGNPIINGVEVRRRTNLHSLVVTPQTRVAEQR